MEEADKERLDYFQKHALPWQLEHLKLRAQGLNLFIVFQGALLVAWSNLRSDAIPVFALIACFSFFLWEQRNRYIIAKVHEWGRDLADRHLFPPADFGPR